SGLLALTLPTSDSGDDASTTTTTLTPNSAAGKPCVALADPLPPGAPEVPVQLGPPPVELVATDLVPGAGPIVTASATLTVHYIGASCSTGRIFDSSWSRGEPASFSLSGVIKGWQEGLPGMAVGGRRLLGIPPALAYADRGSGSLIAPGETLWFVVDLLDAQATG
ncbi:MAG: FKBP-type peptidyl-prolyl cis-trans isomerase, partial [Acidimicrobiales bacterium]